MATIPARTASGRSCQTAASSATSGGITSASMRLPDRSASSAGAAATPRSERAGGDESHPFEARTIARIPARIALGRLDQAAATSVSSGSAWAVGSTAGSTCPGSGFSSGKSVSGSGLQIRHRRFDSDRSLSALDLCEVPELPGFAGVFCVSWAPALGPIKRPPPAERLSVAARAGPPVRKNFRRRGGSPGRRRGDSIPRLGAPGRGGRRRPDSPRGPARRSATIAPGNARGRDGGRRANDRGAAAACGDQSRTSAHIRAEPRPGRATFA